MAVPKKWNPFSKKITIATWEFDVVVLGVLIFGVLIGTYLVLFEVFPNIQAATSPWSQTDWSGGTASGTVTSSVTTYASESSVDTASGEIKIDETSSWSTDYSSWSRRKDIVVTNSESEQTNYQTRIEISYDSDMQPDFDDIRFTNSSGDPLDFWTQTYTESTDAVVWVEVDTLIDSDDTTIYLYYGNPGAPSGSNGSDTFLLFDDFESGSIDDDVWTEIDQASGNEIFVENEELVFERLTNDAWDKGVFSDVTFARADISFEMDYEWVVNNSGYDALMMGWHDNGSGASYTNFPYAYYNSGTGSSNPQAMAVYEDGSNRGGVSGSWSLNQDYDVRVRMRATSGAYYEYSTDSGESWDTAYTSSYSSETPLRVGWAFYSGTHHFDNARVRQWLATEPISTEGTEEAKFAASAHLVSNIFDAEYAPDWGTLSYSTSGSGTTTVKVRTDSNSDMSGATAWGSCTSISSGADISSNGCVTDTQQYLQYRIEFSPSGGSTPILEDITITFTPSDLVAPDTNASDLTVYDENGGTQLTTNDWVDSDPYATWTIGDDDASGNGLRGYCVYVGTDEDADPATTGGLLNSANSPVTLSNTTCGFIVAEPGSGSTVEFDLSPSAYHGAPWMTSSSSSYYLHVKAVDLAGNVFAGDPETFQFRFDNTKPSNPVGISAPQGFLRSIESFSVTWLTSGGNAAMDAHSGVKGYQYRIGSGGTWYGDSHTGDEDCNDLITSGSYSLDEMYDSLSTGDNTFYLRTWDNACNVTTTYATAVLKYNADAPSAPQNLTVDPETNTANSFEFEWDPPSDYQGSVSGISYCYVVNAFPSAANCSFTNGTSLEADAYANQPGDNIMYIVARDEAQNINYLDYAQVTFNANTPAPGFPQNLDVADISVKATENWKLAVAWEEPTNTGAGVENYKLYRTTGTKSCSSNFSDFVQIGSTAGTTYADGGLTQQDYSYCVKACDSANNCSAVSQTASGFPDGKFTEPAELTSGPVETNVTTKKGTITWTTDRTSDSKVAYGTVSGEYFDEEPSNSNQTVAHSITLNNLNPGTTYYYVAKWTDEDGNTGISDERSFTTNPPPNVLSVTESNINLTSALITFTVENAVSVNILYGQNINYGGILATDTALSESTYNVPLTNLLDGTTYNYKLQLEDAEGELYSFENHTFTTLPRPRITNVQLQQVVGTAQPAVLISWDSNTEVSSIVRYAPSSNPSAAITEVDVERISGEHQMLIQGLFADTTYSLTVSGQDRLGNEASSDPQNFTTASDTRPPKITGLEVESSLTSAAQQVADVPTAQVVVTWTTDELATSQVEFGEGTGTTYSQQTQKDENLTFNHTVVISGLQASKVYHLRALSEDNATNIGRSVDTVTITPKATDNALDLVISSLQQIFGFLR